MAKIIKRLLLLGLVLALSLIGVNLYVLQASSPYVYENIADIPPKQTIIVLGAYVRGTTLSRVLEDRVDAGLDIYSDGKASRILLSGDHGRKDYDEVNSMRAYILENDPKVLPEVIFMDHAGFDTYDSMYRAKDVFQVESAVIVTQKFHINRAVYIANALGIDAVGYAVPEDKYPQSIRIKWGIRESLARFKAAVDLAFNSSPTYLGNPIPITGDGRETWDKLD